MSSCSAGKCSITCNDGCGCISDDETGKCDCICSGASLSSEMLGIVASGRFNVCLHDISRANLLTLLGHLGPTRNSISTERLEEKLNIELKQTTLHDLLHHAGLS
jgi:hypothetical protein